ncbi:TIGR01777 family oxidoreductase [Candidatus Nomurabacteria bacterium]|nr:TIGR01777 family oxidoreductase [Candidatus Nomurabacteria bacterium]
MIIVIAGGSGFIGTQLSKKLIDLGHTVVIVDIYPPSFSNKELFFINCDITKQSLPYNILEKTDAVINLVGKPINSKWTEKNKTEIKNSRVNSTRHIVESIISTSIKPSCFICASAIGYYGDTNGHIADETTSKGKGFLSDLVQDWENQAMVAEKEGVRVVCVRTAPVLGSSGGLLKQLKRTAGLGFLLRLKKEDFWMSWIHEEDIVNTYLFALETKTVQGVFNASSPEPVTHKYFMKSLSVFLHRRVVGYLPRFISKRVFGELFDEITKSQQVVPNRLLDKGFVFKYPTLSSTFDQLFKK